MRKTINECCGCAVPGYPCLGDSCPNLHVLHIYCDACDSEDDEMYCYDGKDYCPNCMLKVLTDKGIIEKADLENE